jgi:hypothetical protein
MKRSQDMTLIERIASKVDNAYNDLLEILENESIDNVKEFVQEMKDNHLYVSLDYIRRILINDGDQKSRLNDKIIRILVARNMILKGEDASVAIYTLTRD